MANTVFYSTGAVLRKREVMKKILPYFKKYKKECFLGPLFKLLEATFELLVPIVVGLIVDKGLGTGVFSSGKIRYPQANPSYIIWLCILLVAFGLVGFIFSIIAQYFAAKAATGVSSDLRKALFQKIQSLSYADLDKLGTAKMLTRITGDVNRFQAGVNLAIRLLLRSPFIVFGAMITAFFVDGKSALVFVGAIPLLSLVVFGIMAFTMPLHKKAQEELDGVLLSTRENIAGARVIRAFCLEENEEAEFVKRNKRLTKKRTFADVISALTNPLTYVFINLAIILLIYVGGVRVNHGSLSQGKVLALYNLMTQILVELIKLANLIVSISKALACGNRVEKVLMMNPSLQYKAEGEKTEDYIRFDGVSVKYHKEGQPALSNVSFTAKRGQTIGVIGGTGSGKTTLVHLLPHLYDVAEGQVFVDGRDVASYSKEEIRDKIAIVPQKSVLFKGTIRENLAWGRRTATDEEMWQALRIACVDDVIKEKGGLDAFVERGGKNFSGGQRQRLCIARALVKKAQILILDDSFSALDYVTDRKVRGGISTLEDRPTVFIVSQRASAVGGADQIIVLDDGEMVGCGKEETLLKDCPVYREIYSTQYELGGEKA